MYIPFDALTQEIGRSLQAAQDRLEQEAVDSFFRNFQTLEGSSGRWEIPLTRRIGLPAGGSGELRSLDVPTAALFQHQAVGLDCVKVRLAIKTQVRSEDNALLVEPCSGGEELNDTSNIGQVEFVFKSSPPSEGIARLDLNVQKIL